MQKPLLTMRIQVDTYNELLQLRQKHGTFDKSIKALINCCQEKDKENEQNNKK